MRDQTCVEAFTFPPFFFFFLVFRFEELKTLKRVSSHENKRKYDKYIYICIYIYTYIYIYIIYIYTHTHIYIYIKTKLKKKQVNELREEKKKNSEIVQMFLVEQQQKYPCRSVVRLNQV
ncbi:hypothetical protein K0M31_000034 [Melipona bicolor]|uniref:Transmembrane protein n=1 Tax=Melipona bicolor TaxID=60889 RepID=A0AA40KWD1_9HYME|nr:hypothetical protein K0M31_000034 [Melipona bicolor]